jgi:hypothetical protein
VRVSRVMAAAVLSTAGVFAFSAPASAADVQGISNSSGDYAKWVASTDRLTVCDNSQNNGTAMAILQVVGGGQWQLFDSNGAQSGCSTAGPLNVDNTKAGILYICTNSSASSCASRSVDL